MSENVLQEIVRWKMWEQKAGRDPKVIKLAKHHREALSECIQPYLQDGKYYVFGMEIIPV